MKIVIQRVMKASLTVEGKSRASINQGLVLLVGIGPDDVQEDLTYAVRKITNMRIFSDEEGKMNLSVRDIRGRFFLCLNLLSLLIRKKATVRPSQEQRKRI